MLITHLVDEDFVNYKKPALFIGFPTCTFKCDREAGTQICQNLALASMSNIEVTYDELVERYMNNPITTAVVCGGLEPLDSMSDLLDLIVVFRKHTDDDIVVYTGYNENEPELTTFYNFISHLMIKNIIIKCGRFIPNDAGRFDDVLGVKLASINQRAFRV